MKLIFHPGTNMAQAMAETINYVNRSRAMMPPGTVPPIVMRFDTRSVPVGYLVFSSETRTIAEIQDQALFNVRPMFSALPGARHATRNAAIVADTRSSSPRILANGQRLQRRSVPTTTRIGLVSQRLVSGHGFDSCPRGSTNSSTSMSENQAGPSSTHRRNSASSSEPRCSRFPAF